MTRAERQFKRFLFPYKSLKEQTIQDMNFGKTIEEQSEIKNQSLPNQTPEGKLIATTYIDFETGKETTIYHNKD